VALRPIAIAPRGAPARLGSPREAVSAVADPDTAVFGLCICGGMSRRMGEDKAAMLLGDRTLLERAVATLSAVSEAVVLATGRAPRYSALGCRTALDRYADAGPLAGLEAGLTLGASESSDGERDDHADAGERDAFVVVLPCDMPRVDQRLLADLLERARREERVAACLLSTSAGIEPLCGVDHTRALFAIRAALRAGERKVLSFARHTLRDGTLPRIVAVPESDLRGRGGAETSINVDTAVINVNTPDDLSAERARCAGEETA
jgi:molybdopterin-guanine dinucleotide biosynthesis protein A